MNYSFTQVSRYVSALLLLFHVCLALYKLNLLPLSSIFFNSTIENPFALTISSLVGYWQCKIIKNILEDIQRYINQVYVSTSLPETSLH